MSKDAPSMDARLRFKVARGAALLAREEWRRAQAEETVKGHAFEKAYSALLGEFRVGMRVTGSATAGTVTQVEPSIVWVSLAGGNPVPKSPLDLVPEEFT